MPHRAVIFNLYGTLVHEQRKRSMFDATVQMAHELGVDPIRFASCWFSHAEQTPQDRTLSWIESNLDAVCKELEIDLHPVLRRRLGRQRDDLMLKTLFPRQGALKGLAKIRGQGLKTAIVGDTPPDVPPILQGMELARHLDLVLLSTSNTWRHDDPRVLGRVVQELGVPANTCMYVSAREDDLYHASALGMTAVRLDTSIDQYRAEPYNPRTGYHQVGTLLEVYWLATDQQHAAVA